MFGVGHAAVRERVARILETKRWIHDEEHRFLERKTAGSDLDDRWCTLASKLGCFCCRTLVAVDAGRSRHETVAGSFLPVNESAPRPPQHSIVLDAVFSSFARVTSLSLSLSCRLDTDTAHSRLGEKRAAQWGANFKMCDPPIPLNAIAEHTKPPQMNPAASETHTD